jgi:transcriptional regulator with XRE-family HTH domain
MTTETIKLMDEIIGEKTTFGKTLWSIRKCDEISQVAFAKKIGVSKQYLCDLEHNRRAVSPKQASKFADILGYSPIVFIKAVLQDMLDKDSIDLEVELHGAA